MTNCNNCGGPPSIHHNGCDYCGTNVPIKKSVSYFEGRSKPRSAAIPPKAQKLLDDFWVPVERLSRNFNPRDWGHYDPRCHWWLTPCGVNVEMIRDYIEMYGEEAPRVWQQQTKTNWPKRIR